MQSRKHSLFEQCCNVGSGFIISLAYWQLAIVPQIDGRDMTMTLNLIVTLQFTIISVTRGYLWRRFFNRLIVNRLERL